MLALQPMAFPASEKLTDAVDHVLQQGIQTVLMVHHGVLVCGRDKAQAMERVQLLEKICERNVSSLPAKFKASVCRGA